MLSPAVQAVVDRHNASPEDACTCVTFPEARAAIPLIEELVTVIEDDESTTVGEAIWHAFVLCVATGYALGSADAFEGMAEIASLVERS